MNAQDSAKKPVVLVTGAGGRIGRAIWADLERDYTLKGVDVRPGEPDAPPIHQLDLGDFPATLAAMAGVDRVVHLAIASRRHMQDWPEHEADDEEMRVNVLGTQHVYEAARQAGVKRVVFMSSLTISLGEPRLAWIGEPASAVRPSNLYACTKLFGEHLAELYARQFDLPIICIRLGQPYPMWPGHYEKLADPKRRWGAVSFEDIAQAVRGGLEAQARFAIVNIASESDARTVELDTAQRVLGYSPRTYFTADGPTPNAARAEEKR